MKSVKNKVGVKVRGRVSRQAYDRLGIHLSSKVSSKVSFQVDSQVWRKVYLKVGNDIS